MKTKHNAGFSLVEVLVAIVLLGTLVVPICSALVLTFRMNEKTDNLLRAQLAVSSAVETLLAEGISEKKIDEIYDGDTDFSGAVPAAEVPSENATEPSGEAATEPAGQGEQTVPVLYDDGTGRFSRVQIQVWVLPSKYLLNHADVGYKAQYDCYRVTVTSRDDSSVSVTTMIREQEVTAS